MEKPVKKTIKAAKSIDLPIISLCSKVKKFEY